MPLFKPNDLRGEYPKEINKDIAKKIGFVLPKFLAKKDKKITVLICYDSRPSSKIILKGLAEGLLLNKNLKITTCGLASTPYFYWQAKKQKADLGIMITASHNPPKYNGLKIVKKQAVPFVGKDFKQLEKLFKKANLPEKNISLKNKVKKINNLEEYVNFLIKKSGIKKIKPFRIAIDCSNGTIGKEIKKLTKKLKINSKIIFAKPDGTFPNHSPNPLKKQALKPLSQLIKAERLDFGVIFDGDGDRIVFLDQKGRTIRRDFVAAYLAKKYLEKTPNLKIAYGPQASLVFKETILKNKGRAIAAKTGHAFIKKLMRKKGIFFSGETSGHYFFKKLGYIDNALFAFLEMLKFLSQESKSFSEIFKPFKKYHQSGQINIPLKEKINRKKFLAAFKKELKKYQPAKISQIDGLSIFFKGWWFNLRFSNTENLIRLNVESENKKALKEKTKVLLGLVKKLEKI